MIAQRIDGRDLVALLKGVSKIARMKDQGAWPQDADRAEISRAVETYDRLSEGRCLAELLDSLGVSLRNRV